MSREPFAVRMNMKARDLFGVVVRGFGLFVLLISLWCLIYALLGLLNTMPDVRLDGDSLFYLISSGPGLLVGFILLRFGRAIVRFCYSEGKEDSEE